MSVQDLELNCKVRGIVARYWVDSNRLSFNSRRGHVCVSGELRVTGKHKGHDETAGMLRSLEYDVRRLQDVRAVEFELTNWIRDEGRGWICKEKRLLTKPAEITAPASARPSFSARSTEST